MAEDVAHTVAFDVSCRLHFATGSINRNQNSAESGLTLSTVWSKTKIARVSHFVREAAGVIPTALIIDSRPCSGGD